MKPENIGQASRIGGVNPVDITNLLIFLQMHKQKFGDMKPNATEKERRKALVKSAMASAEEAKLEALHA